MPRRAANIAQADIARTLRAMRDAGLSVTRVVVRPDGGVSIETADAAAPEGLADGILPRDPDKRIIL